MALAIIEIDGVDAKDLHAWNWNTLIEPDVGEVKVNAFDTAKELSTAVNGVGRKDTIHRLKYAADSAERIMRRYADRKKEKEAQYYAGMRDAYLLAIKTLEIE